MSKILKTTPRHDGFRMLAEWEYESQVWLLWPERPDVWRKNALYAQKTFAELANYLSDFRQVVVGVTKKQKSNAKELLSNKIRLELFDYDDVWIRDTGPIFVINNKGVIRGISWKFNAWGGNSGGLYESWKQDEKVALRVLQRESIDAYMGPLILEGGSIHTDGQGTLITTESCLLNSNRNGNLSKNEIEKALKDFLGIRKVVWLKQGVSGDETDGHIDNLVSYIKPGVVFLNWTEDSNNPDYEIVREAYNTLNSTIDAEGRRITIIKVGQPSMQKISSVESAGVERRKKTYPRLTGNRLVSSYINYYRDRGLIVLPSFGDKHADNNALLLFKKYFLNTTILQVDAREIILGGGGIHCITLNQSLIS